MNKLAVIYLSTGSLLLGVCIVLTVMYRMFRIHFHDVWAYVGIVCVILGLLVLVVGLKYTRN